jgi:hypothetical protein
MKHRTQRDALQNFIDEMTARQGNLVRRDPFRNKPLLVELLSNESPASRAQLIGTWLLFFFCVVVATAFLYPLFRGRPWLAGALGFGILALGGFKLWRRLPRK